METPQTQQKHVASARRGARFYSLSGREGRVLAMLSVPLVTSTPGPIAGSARRP